MESTESRVRNEISMESTEHRVRYERAIATIGDGRDLSTLPATSPAGQEYAITQLEAKAGWKRPHQVCGIPQEEDTMKKERTPEQIAARRAKSKARREAKKALIEVNEANLEKLKANFKAIVAKFQAGELSIKDAGPLWNMPSHNLNRLTQEQLQAKIEKQRARLARLEEALRG